MAQLYAVASRALASRIFVFCDWSLSAADYVVRRAEMPILSFVRSVHAARPNCGDRRPSCITRSDACWVLDMPDFIVHRCRPVARASLADPRSRCEDARPPPLAPFAASARHRSCPHSARCWITHNALHSRTARCASVRASHKQGARALVIPRGIRHGVSAAHALQESPALVPRCRRDAARRVTPILRPSIRASTTRSRA
jgi:hypothetical protein